MAINKRKFSLNEQPEIFKEFLTYMYTIKNKSENTIYEYSLDLTAFFRFLKIHFELVDSSVEFNDILINDLKMDFIKKVSLYDIYEFLAYISTNKKNAASTRARKVACIRSYFKYMTNRAKYLDENPAADLDSPKIKQSLPRYLELTECKELLSTVNKNPDQELRFRDFAIITLFLNCGLRLSELVNINISDVKSDTLVVTGKGNKERTVYLNDACLNAIEAYIKIRPKDGLKDRNALFLSKRKSRISNKTIQYLVKNYIKLAGLDETKFSVHKLRHTAATIMYRYGETDLRTIQEILGHEQLATTQIYTHVSDTQKRDAAKNNPLSHLDELT